MVTICTVCQSEVKKLHKYRYRTTALSTKTRDTSLLDATILNWNSNRNVYIKWVKGHLEKVETDAALWTREMWGNHLSDRSAAGVLTSPIYQHQNLFDNIPLLTPLPPLDALSLTPSLVLTGAWYFGTEKRQLLSSSTLDRIYSKRLTKYLMDRDK